MEARRSWFPVVAFLIMTIAIQTGANTAVEIPYPQGYRSWTHVTTMLVGPSSPFFQSSGGIHHVYANDKAMRGYSGGKFPDGSILVFDLHDAEEKDGVTSEGVRQRIDKMLKDSRRFAATGGWRFETLRRRQRN